LNFECQTNYHFASGNAQLTCTDTGVLINEGTQTSDPLVCSESCTIPTTPNGHLKDSGQLTLTAGSTIDKDTFVVLVCDSGFAPSPSETHLECQAGSSFVPSVPDCLPACSVPDPAEMLHAALSIQAGNAAVGDALFDTQSYLLTCVDKYALNSDLDVDSELFCSVEETVATLDSAPACLRQCELPLIDHTIFPNEETTNLVAGDVLFVSCAEGFEISSGSTARTCTDPTPDTTQTTFGTWSGDDLVCSQVCQIPDVGAGTLFQIVSPTEQTRLLDTVVSVGVSLKLYCNAGAGLVSNTFDEFDCQPSVSGEGFGVWSTTTGRCAAQCTVPVTPFGALPGAESPTPGTTVLAPTSISYQCDTVELFRPAEASSATATCTDSGSMSAADLICVALCPVFTLPDGAEWDQSEPGTHVDAGVSLQIRCSEATTAVSGDTSRQCQNDHTFSGTPLVCTPICEIPALDESKNTTWVSTGGVGGVPLPGGRLLEGQTLVQRCLDGYGLNSGDLTRTCQSSGDFSGSEASCLRQCQVPSLEGGSKTPVLSVVLDGASVEFSCDEFDDYVWNSGAKQQTCTSQGFLSPSDDLGNVAAEVECARRCIVPAAPDHAQYVDLDGVTYILEGESLDVACLDQFRLVSGDASRVCDRDTAAFLGTEPVCEDVCLAPSVPGASKSAPDVTLGQNVTYACLAGYELFSGTAEVTCAAGGEFSQDLPVCSRMCALSQVNFNAKHIELMSDLGRAFAWNQELIEVGCESGFFPAIGQGNWTCLSTGQFSHELVTSIVVFLWFQCVFRLVHWLVRSRILRPSKMRFGSIRPMTHIFLWVKKFLQSVEKDMKLIQLYSRWNVPRIWSLCGRITLQLDGRVQSLAQLLHCI
jgi:hypothetical protein